jgi:hypothetical protein
MPVSLSDLVDEFKAAQGGRRDANTAKAAKGAADQLREQKAQGNLTPEQVTALDAEIDRLDPPE